MGMFGFGTSENKSTTNVSNQQVATESGIALGANSTNTVSIMTADPEIAKASFAANVGVSEAALKTNALTSGLAIASAENMSKSFISGVNDNFATTAALLQSSAQDNAAISNKLVGLADKSLSESFQNAARSTEQTEGYQNETASNNTTKIILGVLLVVGVAAFFIFRRGR